MAVTVVLGARLGGRQRSSMRGQMVIDVGTSSRPMPAPGGRKLKKTRAGRGGSPPVSSSAASAAGENWSTMSSHHWIFHTVQSCAPTMCKLESALCCSFIREKLTHLLFVVISEVELSRQTYGDDYRPSSPALSFIHAVLRYGFFTRFLVFVLYLPFISFWVFLISL